MTCQAIKGKSTPVFVICDMPSNKSERLFLTRNFFFVSSFLPHLTHSPSYFSLLSFLSLRLPSHSFPPPLLLTHGLSLSSSLLSHPVLLLIFEFFFFYTHTHGLGIDFFFFFSLNLLNLEGLEFVKKSHYP
jgi:hypothetical protein